MRILIDIGHPAHVHYFKNFASHFLNCGDEVIFTVRNKEIAIDLLKIYKFPYVVTGKPYKSKIGKIAGLFIITLKVFIAAVKFKPDFLINFTFYSAFTSFLLRKPHISIEDTFNKESVNLVMPFTNHVFTGIYAHPALGKKELMIPSYQELMYLHPRYFNADKKVLKELGVKEGEKYIIMRFVSWRASHDYGHKGILLENKIKAVENFSKIARVFITSEGELPVELEKYRIKINFDKMHDAIAFSSLVFGESSTMSEEAAMLGVPSIYLFNNGTYYTKHLEKDYELMYNFSESNSDQIKAIEKGMQLLSDPNLKQIWNERRDKMIKDKIDFTALLIWFVENYPSSFKIMKENPDYQYNFI